MTSLEINISGSVQIFKTKIRNWDLMIVLVTYVRSIYVNNLGLFNGYRCHVL